MLRTTDIAWLAGLLEGEGSFNHNQGKGPKTRITTGHLSISVSMTDEDIILRVGEILGFGTFNKPRPLPSGKTAYGWSVTNQQQAAGLMMTLLPLMGKRRAVKIIECLDAWKAKDLRKSLWTHCKDGHPLSGDNLRIVLDGKYTKRRCRICEYNRSMKYRGSTMRR